MAVTLHRCSQMWLKIGAHPCWVVVKQLGSGATLFAGTLQPQDAERFVQVSGSTSIEIGAHANAITVRNSRGSLGTIADPTVGAVYDLTARSN